MERIGPMVRSRRTRGGREKGMMPFQMIYTWVGVELFGVEQSGARKKADTENQSFADEAYKTWRLGATGARGLPVLTEQILTQIEIWFESLQTWASSRKPLSKKTHVKPYVEP